METVLKSARRQDENRTVLACLFSNVE